MSAKTAWYEGLLSKNLVPDFLIRAGIRLQLANKLRIEKRGGIEDQQDYLSGLVRELRSGPVAVNTADANEQHYEVPTEFYRLVLGRHLKYSSGFWKDGDTLDSSEARMLELYCERAKLQDGQVLMDLGCGWGSLSLYLAGKYPASSILAVSNSSTQRAWIEAEAARRGLQNLKVETCDINVFETAQRFDRILSVEMFEHMRNYERLLEKVSGWLKPDGYLFVHIFTHRNFAYPFQSDNPSNWMARYFFTGGMMPSEELLLYFQRDVRLLERWRVDGRHYQKTCEAWLSRMDANRERIMEIFRETYGADQALKWWVYWRIFFMACAELFGYHGGSEWSVTHYLFAPQSQNLKIESAGGAGLLRQ